MDFDTWWATTPESKLELIDGQLIISTLAGSRRVAWYLLHDYGPALALPLAPTDLWWTALGQAFEPQPVPQTPTEWAAWADHVAYDPEPAPAGPYRSAAHQRVFRLLRNGLYSFASTSRLGQSLGYDFVVRLDENGLTPDLIFIDRNRLVNLHDYYLDGPPALAIEITLEGSGNADHDRDLKRRLYERAGLPEYWLVEPATQEIIFYRLGADGRYQPLVVDRQGVPQGEGNGRLTNRWVTSDASHQGAVDGQGVYHLRAVPGLALAVPRLWTMEETNWQEPWWPFLPATRTETKKLPKLQFDSDDLSWDSLPFAPRVGLQPVPISFAEYISWSPEAKFERLYGRLEIGGREGSRRVLGLLLMTLGLVEVVKLAQPREWVTFLEQEKYQAVVRRHTEALMRHAQYQSYQLRPNEIYFHGEILQLPEVSAFGETQDECEQNLAEMVRNWVLLRIARQQEIPTLK